MALLEGPDSRIAAEPPLESPPSKKRRRPSGEPPPLPRHLASGKYWLALSALIVITWIGIITVTGAGAQANRFDGALLDPLIALRTPWLTRIAEWFHALGSEWLSLSLRWGVVIALVAFKRFRHLFVFIASILGVGLITAVLSQALTRSRPLEIDIIGHWEGAAHPSRPLAALAVTLVGICYTLVVPGKPRTVAKWSAAAAIGALAFGRLYLGVDHPTDVIAAAVIGVAIPLTAFRLLTPNDAFPVTYQGGKTAHLDVEGPRGDAIKAAVEDQLGVSLVDVCPFGLGGSAGSTPLRLTVAGEPSAALFAKLYASNHLRSDRWYKLGRTLLYGRLEDESSFSTVRRLVQYEDYMLRVMRDAQLPTPKPYGFVEITPEREYLLLTDFVPGGKELLDADVTDDVIDQSLEIIRRMWDAGIAHRDVKPSNLLVSRGRVHLIDVAFGEVRPTPWRQAVDLANIMLVLALRADAERVYRAALKYFSPNEVAEAFAATHGVTIPSQTRALLRRDDRDLIAEFRALVPEQPRIAIQRWSLRRLGLMTTVVLTVGFLLILAFSNFRGAGLLPPAEGGTSAYSGVTKQPKCEGSDQMILVAQSVPSATLLPCIAALPTGWSFAGMDISDDKTEIFLDSDRAGFRAVNVTLTRSCDVGRATEVPTDEPGTRQLERVRGLHQDRYAGSRYYTFRGGCVRYDFDFSGVGRTALTEEASLALTFVDRDRLAHELEQDIGFEL